MTSLEIAELVEKRHDNVKRTIETLIMRGVITSPQIEEKPTAGAPHNNLRF
ncbi:DNA-binding protein Roi [Klebsiella pneumoniae]|nr:DNA-binding protein Roi [Klebsiella pneumoniae]